MKKKIINVFKLLLLVSLLLCIVFIQKRNEERSQNKEPAYIVHDENTTKAAQSENNSIKLEHSIYYLNIGEQEEIKVLNNNASELNWFTYNEFVAVVDGKGTITGVAEGRTNIFAALTKDEYAYVEVVVSTNKEEAQKQDLENNITSQDNNDYDTVRPPIYSTEIPNSNNQTPNENSVTTTNPRSSQNYSSNQNSGSSQNPGYQDQSSNRDPEENQNQGTAKNPNSGKNVSVSGVLLNKTSIKLNKGGKETLVATVSPSNASNKKVIWSSSNNNVATVSNGVVTAKQDGTAKITATTEDGRKTSSCTVTVDNSVYATGINLSTRNVKLGSGSAGSTQVKATVVPSNTTNKTVTWKTNNSKVATVDKNGVIKGVHSGSATITATTSNGKTSTVTVTVTSVERIHFIPQKENINDTVSKGDAILLESDGYYAMIDTGGTKDISHEHLLKYLNKFGINKNGYALDFVLLTHIHPDHVGGIKTMLNKKNSIKINTLYIKRYSTKLGEAYPTFKSIIDCSRGSNTNCAKAGDTVLIQDIDKSSCPTSSNQAHGDSNCTANLKFHNMSIKLYNTGYVMKAGDLGPNGRFYKSHKKVDGEYETYNANYESVYEYITVKGHRIVLAADALGDYTGTSLNSVLFESDKWYEVIKGDSGTGIDILKAPHHGDYNSDKNFSKLRPKNLVVTNSYNQIKSNTSGIKDYDARIYYVEYYKPGEDIKTLYADLTGSEVQWGRISIYK